MSDKDTTTKTGTYYFNYHLGVTAGKAEMLFTMLTQPMVKNKQILLLIDLKRNLESALLADPTSSAAFGDLVTAINNWLGEQ